MRPWVGFFALSLLIAVAPAGAHPQAYVNAPGGDLVLVCGAPGGVNLGGVCFAPGHLSEASIILIEDDVLSGPFSGVACYGAGAGLPCEDAVSFCGSVLGGSNLVAIFLDGPLFGNGVLGACGLASFATKGEIDHT